MDAPHIPDDTEIARPVYRGVQSLKDLAGRLTGRFRQEESDDPEAPKALLARRIAFFIPIRLSALLLKLGFNRTAGRILTLVARHHAPRRYLLRLLSDAYSGRTSGPFVTQLRFQRLSRLIKRPIEKRQYGKLLTLAAQYELIQKNIPVKAGELLARQMVSEVGRNRIMAGAEQALKESPDSAYLAHLYALTLAKAGEYRKASEFISEKIAETTKQEGSSKQEMTAIKRRFEILRTTWRVIDAIARENVEWLDEEKGAGYTDLAHEDKVERLAPETQTALLNFKEPLLQAKDEEGYLALCLKEYDHTKSLIVKLKSIKEMLRQGTRRLLRYHRTFEVAGDCLDQIAPKLKALANRDPDSFANDRQAMLAVQTLCLALEVKRGLSRTEDLDEIKSALVRFSDSVIFRPWVWFILPALVMEDTEKWGPVSRKLAKTLAEAPKRDDQIKAYFSWAMRMREFDAADKLYRRLPSAKRGATASLYYVNILQRQSRFIEAIRAIRLIHAYHLAKPLALNAWQHSNLVRRYQELQFLRETAARFSKCPQPQKPKGVILIVPRNIDQLRKYPLVALMELKLQGWAVVPLVEGLLPREMTGIPSIDVLNGCITTELGLRKKAASTFKPLEDFEIDVSKGSLRWKGVDLSHPMKEDAMIHRRAYNIDFSCPSLQQTLGKLSDWTEKAALAVNYAHALFEKMELRCGLMSLFNSRLPDALFRLYCEKYGDPETFFCLHTSNGYENYFKNFSTNISTRCVVRNVTKYPSVRAASFPVPDYFNRYYEVNQYRADAVINKVAHIADVRRSTGGNKTVDPEAAACMDKILDWRARGGKVACLFGKVVCDSGVPYDGGPVHKDFKDWINHSIDAVRGSDTLLIIKPHPHELNEQIATYLNEYLTDLIEVDLPENVMMLGHRWFDLEGIKDVIDLGVIYNGTTAIEMALHEVPCVLCSYFAPVDYPVGHMTPKSKEHYEDILTFRIPHVTKPDMRARASMWLEYMSNGEFTIDYRYTSRPMTNKVIYPPYWFGDDIDTYLKYGDGHVDELVARITGDSVEPGGNVIDYYDSFDATPMGSSTLVI